MKTKELSTPLLKLYQKQYKRQMKFTKKNIKRLKIIISVLCVIGLTTTSQGQTIAAFNVDSIIQISNNYFKQNRYEKALHLLEETLLKCTNSSAIHRITGLMIDYYFTNKQSDNFFSIIDYGHKHDVVYRFPKFFADSLKNCPEYDKALITNDSLLTIQRKIARPAYEVVLPDIYNEGTEYPLFIVLTKGWRTKQILINSYRSPRVRDEFIVAFIHSSDFRGTNFYEWPEDESETMPEIKNLYSEITSKYPIDTTKVIISGMSNAGRMAIHTAFRSQIPVSGFVTFCAVNANISNSEIKAAVQKNIKGMLVAGKEDKRFFSDSEAMFRKLKSNNFLVRFEPGDFRHEIPTDSYSYIDEAVKFITE